MKWIIKMYSLKCIFQTEFYTSFLAKDFRKWHCVGVDSRSLIGSTNQKRDHFISLCLMRARWCHDSFLRQLSLRKVVSSRALSWSADLCVWYSVDCGGNLLRRGNHHRCFEPSSEIMLMCFSMILCLRCRGDTLLTELWLLIKASLLHFRHKVIEKFWLDFGQVRLSSRQQQQRRWTRDTIFVVGIKCKSL